MSSSSPSFSAIVTPFRFIEKKTKTNFLYYDSLFSLFRMFFSSFHAGSEIILAVYKASSNAF